MTDKSARPTQTQNPRVAPRQSLRLPPQLTGFGPCGSAVLLVSPLSGELSFDCRWPKLIPAKRVSAHTDPAGLRSAWAINLARSSRLLLCWIR